MPKFNNRENPSYIVTNTNGGSERIFHSRSVAIVAFVIFIKNNTKYVLISQRGPNSADYQGYWNMVCGYLDWDETSYEAALREVWEETGVDLQTYINDEHTEVVYASEEPYTVSSKTDANRQNVTLYHAFIIKLNNNQELPTVTNENAEHGEVGEIKFVSINSPSEPDRSWAFKHDEKIKDAIKRFLHLF